MKIFIYTILALAVALLIFNATKINLSTPFEGDSKIAVISVLACACAVILLIILQVSRGIAEKRGK